MSGLPYYIYINEYYYDVRVILIKITLLCILHYNILMLAQTSFNIEIEFKNTIETDGMVYIELIIDKTLKKVVK